MSLADYSNLKQSISDWLDRDFLDDQIDNFIDLAEARHAREIRIRQMLTSDDLTLPKGDRAIPLPNDFLDQSFLRVKAPDTLCRRFFPDLDEVTVYELSRVSVNAKQRPRRFAIRDEEIEFDAEADQDYTVSLFYYAQLTPLSDTNPTNVLLERAPDVYLYAALSATAPFLVNDERLRTWEAMYAAARDGLNRSSHESRRGGPLVSKVAGVTP